MFGCPDIVWGGLVEDVGPEEGFHSFYGFKIALAGLHSGEERLRGLKFHGLSSGLCELLAEGGEEGGPPGLGSGGVAGAGCRGFNCDSEGGWGGGETLVVLRGWRSRQVRWDQPAFGFICQAGPVGIVLVWSGLVLVGGGW